MRLSGIVFIVDDDSAVLDSIGRLVESAGWSVERFSSGRSFLDRVGLESTGCVLLDVRMPELSGLTVQKRLIAESIVLPIVFITGYPDVPAAVQAMKNGAVGFLEKPIAGHVLLEEIEAAVALGVIRQALARERRSVEDRLDGLTPRQRQIFDLLVQGCSNKEIASTLGITARTTEVHRSLCMKRMEASSYAELVRMGMVVRRPYRDDLAENHMTAT